MNPGMTLCMLVALLALGAGAGAAETVYASNYDVILKAGEDSRQVHSRARVRDGHAIPVELGPYKVEVAVSGEDEETVAIELRLFEKSGGAWYRIPAEGLTFPAPLGAPVEFTWVGADLELDVALILSVFER